MISLNLKNGFTLIEMMITLAILSVVAAIAIPAYTGYVTTAKMSEAHNSLAALRLAEEENYLETNSYFPGANATDIANNSNGLWSVTKGSDGLVNFDYVVTLSSGWTATATPKAGTSLAGQPAITVAK